MAALPPKTIMHGNPPSPAHQPVPSELADWMQEFESLAAGGGLNYVNHSVAALQARSGVSDDEFALVVTTASEGGIYERVSGNWVKVAGIPAIFTESQAAIEALASAANALASEQSAAASEASAESDRAGAELARSQTETARTQAELAAQAAGATMYDSVANGLAGTSNGDVFLVQIEPGTQVYRNDGGSDTLLGWLGEVLFDDVISVLTSSLTGFSAGTTIRTRKDSVSLIALDAGDPVFDRQNAGGTKFLVPGRNQFFPEAFGAVGDGVADDTAAWNALLAAVARASASGPVFVYGRGHYLVDQLEALSQYAAGTIVGLQQDSVFFDLRGAVLEHSGVGDGILFAEGNGVTRHKTNLDGGQFIPHANTKWLTKARDLRSSRWAPEMYGGTTGGNCIGHVAELWRTWSENMSYGAAGDKLEVRQIAHGLAFFGRAESWAIEAMWSNPSWFVQGANNLGYFYADDAAAVAAKGSAAVEGDYYYRREAGYGAGYRIYRASGWVDAMYCRGEVFGWAEHPIATSDPVSPEKGDLYYNSAASEVRVWDGSAWQVAHQIPEVDTSISGRSFARTNIYDLLLASPYSDSADGQAILVQNASLYESNIDGVRGVSDNNGNSLIYWNVAFAPGTIIQNIGVEKANIGGNPEGMGVRAGPRVADAPKPPLLRNIRYSTSRGLPVDPLAGFVWEGQDYENFITTVAGTPVEVVNAGMLWPNTMFEITVKSNDNEVLASAIVARKNASSVLQIIDKMASTVIVPFSVSSPPVDQSLVSMAGSRFVAPRGGSLVGITVCANTNVGSGNINCEPRISTGDLNASGANPNLDATLFSGFFAQNTQDPLSDTFEAGNSIYAVYETTTFSGPTEVQCGLELLLNGLHEWGADVSGNLTLKALTSETDLRVTMRVLKP